MGSIRIKYVVISAWKMQSEYQKYGMTGHAKAAALPGGSTDLPILMGRTVICHSQRVEVLLKRPESQMFQKGET